MTYTAIVIRIPAVALVACAAAGCGSAPPVTLPTTDPNLALDMKIEQKVSWMLQLEDRRILKVPAPPAPAPPPAPPSRARGRAAATPAPAPVLTPDLTKLLTDSEPRVRRRAALAIGRVGLPAGVEPLVTALSDNDPDVRGMAAFGLGLIGEASAAAPLIKSLTILWLRIRGVRADWHSATRADDGRWISPARVIRGNCEITIRVPRRLIMAECNFWNSRFGVRLRSRGVG